MQAAVTSFWPALTLARECRHCGDEGYCETYFGTREYRQACDVCCDEDGDVIGEGCECCGARLLSGAPRFHVALDHAGVRALCPRAGCVLWMLSGSAKTEPEDVRKPAHWAVMLDERTRRAMRVRKAMDGNWARLDAQKAVA